MTKRVVWRKSSYSTLEGNCVEFTDLDANTHAVRDSKDPTGPVLTCSPAQWAAFTAAIGRSQVG